MKPIDWVRGELGQKEISGKQDNPRIRWYHTHCANIGSKEHPDEVPWCSSLINAAADECGYEKTDNALAKSWIKYGENTGAEVPEGSIIVIKRSDGGYHVALANKAFNKITDKTFYGIGGNQHNEVNITKYKCSASVATRSFIPLKKAV